MKYLWAGWDKMKDGLTSRKKKLVFLDFDGTLVSIAESPSAVRVDPRTKNVLRTLSADDHVQLVIISGRPLNELRRYLHLKNAVIVGNHGLEINGRGMQLPPNAKKSRKMKKLIGILSQKFKMAFACYPGIWVEDKHYTMSIHFRKLPRGQGAIFWELVWFFRQKYKKYPISWMRGKKVMEIRPSIFWGKGETVNYLMGKFPRAVPVAIGDDKMDEEMFRALKGRGGVSVRVGYSRSSLADYYLSSPYDVKVFLQKLCP